MPIGTKHKLLTFLFAAGVLSFGGAGLALYRYFKALSLKKKKLEWKKHIFICSTPDDWNENDELFLESIHKSQIIGLDCEWVTKNGKRQPVSLLQIATASDLCILVRMSHMAKANSFPLGMLDVLGDDSILKVGIGIWDDVKKLHQDYGIIVKGFFDLRNLVDIIPAYLNMKNKGLKDLAKNVIGVDINKSYRIRCSNWEDEVLSEDQVLYAAGDAVFAAQIFDTLMEEISGKKLSSWFLPLKINNHSLISEFVNVRYSEKSASRNKHVAHLKDIAVKSKKKFSSVRQRPLYDNCVLLAPDGETLCVCNFQKIQWYIERELGEVISEDPLTLQLKFEPSARPILDKEYYIYEKENCCVVCGSNVALLKKCVVPTEYKRYFPEIVKSHLSHDVLLLCVQCHRRSNALDVSLRQELAKECQAPVGTVNNAKIKANPILQTVRSAARALLQTKNSIPASRKEELENIIKEFFHTEQITEEILMMGSNMETGFLNDQYISHGEKVVQHVCKCGGLLDFERRWRQHFLDSMKPKFLPKMWSVTHGHEWLAFQVLEGNIDFDPSILGLSEELLEVAALQKQQMEDAKVLPKVDDEL